MTKGLENQNMHNKRKLKAASSAFKGVAWHKMSGKWQSQIRLSGKLSHIGLFATEIDAATAYNEAAKSLFGQFAKLNSIPDELEKSLPRTGNRAEKLYEHKK